MKKLISKREYDTEAATLLEKRTYGEYGDPAGYEERLYEMPNGLRFFYFNGGENSPHKAESIKAVSKARSEEWLAK